MPPTPGQDKGKVKGRVRRPAKRARPVADPVVYSDDDVWEEDVHDEVLEVNVGAAAQPRPEPRREGEMVFRHMGMEDNPQLLPAELLPQGPRQYDVSDEEDEDHTGTWRDGDIEALVLALNFYRDRIKGKFIGTSGGKERKAHAWGKVAESVNNRCGTRWTVGQCKGKARRYSLDVKNKYNAYRRELNKTGSPEIPDKMYLSKIEEMLLDYIGVEGVVGIPGIQAVPLRPDLGRDYLKKRDRNATAVWNHVRVNKPDYTQPLPRERIHLSQRKK